MNKLPFQGKLLIRLFLYNTGALFKMESKLQLCSHSTWIEFHFSHQSLDDSGSFHFPSDFRIQELKFYSKSTAQII